MSLSRSEIDLRNTTQEIEKSRRALTTTEKEIVELRRNMQDLHSKLNHQIEYKERPLQLQEHDLRLAREKLDKADQIVQRERLKYQEVLDAYTKLEERYQKNRLDFERETESLKQRVTTELTALTKRVEQLEHEKQTVERDIKELETKEKRLEDQARREAKATNDNRAPNSHRSRYNEAA